VEAICKNYETTFPMSEAEARNDLKSRAISTILTNEADICTNIMKDFEELKAQLLKEKS
jgi:hypothetical protein